MLREMKLEDVRIVIETKRKNKNKIMKIEKNAIQKSDMRTTGVHR